MAVLDRDLGTALVNGLVLVAALFLGGMRLKLFGIAARSARSVRTGCLAMTSSTAAASATDRATGPAES